MTIYASKQCAFSAVNINKTNAPIYIIINISMVNINNKTHTDKQQL